jgi:peptidoglycan/xylan/chitin deacetylase (PgdA/CDA1 family)
MPKKKQESFWPSGYQSCFQISFDYDSNSALIRREPWDLVAQSRGRFAPNTSIWRILDLLDDLNLKTTFFVPGWTADQFPESCKEILKRGHEIGAHGYLHEKFTEVSWESERSIWLKSLEALGKLGVKPEGFRAPSWLVSDRTLGFLKEFGFRYDSNFMDNDMPYMLKHRGEDTGLVELPVEWNLDDWQLFEIQKMSPQAAYEIWKPEFEGLHRLGRYFGLTCHPQCSGRISRLDMLERFIREAQAKGDVWFPTCKQVADWTRKKLAP